VRFTLEVQKYHHRGANITIEVQSKRHNLCLFIHDWIWNQKPSNILILLQEAGWFSQDQICYYCWAIKCDPYLQDLAGSMNQGDQNKPRWTMAVYSDYV